MDYISIINDSIEYIENNLGKSVSIDELADMQYISRYYFYRMFRALTNRTVKEYIDERRLTEGAKRIRATRENIVHIAFDLGFESHEVFTRSFKRLFSITPTEYRNSDIKISAYEKIVVVDRAFKNLNKDLVVDFKVEPLGPLNLIGKQMEFNPDNREELLDITSNVLDFVKEYITPVDIDKLYNVTRTDIGSGEGIVYFAGYEDRYGNPGGELSKLMVPESDYAVFKYYGGMVDIHNTIFEDICKVLVVSGLSHTKAGIDFMEVYPKDFFEKQEFYIYVPIKR